MRCRWCHNTHPADLIRSRYNSERHECRDRKACDRRIEAQWGAIRFLKTGSWEAI